METHQPKTDAPHARNYPGHKTGIKEKGSDGAGVHNAAALAAGRANSMGVSANGSHKGLPSGKHPAA